MEDKAIMDNFKRSMRMMALANNVDLSELDINLNEINLKEALQEAYKKLINHIRELRKIKKLKKAVYCE